MEANGSYCKKLISYLVLIILKYKFVSFKQLKESIHHLKKFRKIKEGKEIRDRDFSIEIEI